MGGVEVSVMGWSSTLVNVSPCTRPSCVRNSHMCVSKPMCSCQIKQLLGVDACCQVWTLCKAFHEGEVSLLVPLGAVWWHEMDAGEEKRKHCCGRLIAFFFSDCLTVFA